MIGKYLSRLAPAAAAIALSVGFAADATAQVISVNFGQSAYDLAPSDVAGVQAAPNWNNATASAISSIGNLVDSTGSLTGAGLTWNGGSLTNNVNLALSGSTPDDKLMSHYWGTANDMVAQNLFVETTGTRFHHHLQPNAFSQPTFNTASVTNLNALYPNGYSVIVYVSGAMSGHNEFSNNVSTANMRQFATPIEVQAGPSGLISTVTTGNTTGAKAFMSFGTDHGLAGRDGMSMQDLANLPAGTQRTILWPTTNAGSYYSAGFYGFVQGSLNQQDNYAIDFGPINEWGHQAFEDPWTLGEWPQNAWFGAGQTFEFFWDPTFRTIDVGNYIIFEGLTFDTLELLAANLHGGRTTGGSTATTDQGGITGFQIIPYASSAIPTPAALPAGLAMLVMVGLRRRNA